MIYNICIHSRARGVVKDICFLYLKVQYVWFWLKHEQNVTFCNNTKGVYSMYCVAEIFIEVSMLTILVH